MSQSIPLYIPTYISSIDYNPARVLPRLLFYNGQVDCQTYYIQGFTNGTSSSVTAVAQTAFPYFDNYNVVSGSFPTTDSISLLFNNETSPYGAIPTTDLYLSYWETYVQLLYNPYTRLLNCSAIIPLADYFQMNLNDIVEFRGNYYHLRAINDYNLQNGECSLQLLGPIIPDSINGILFPCNFDFSVSAPTTTSTTTTTTAGPTTTTTAGPTTTTTAGPTTTTTTLAPPTGNYIYYAVSDNCCTDAPSPITGVVAITASIATLVQYQTVAGNNWTGSNGGHCATIEYVTSSTTPLLFVIEESQYLTNTYGIGQCNSCNRDYLPTPSAGICLDYSIINASGEVNYVNCSNTAVTSSFSGGTLSLCSKITPNITYTSDKSNARIAFNCTNCGTY